MQMGLTIGHFTLSGAFTLAGKCRARPGHGAACLAAAAAALLAAAPARAAARDASIGPTSSASVEIRVSVAPGFGLKRFDGPFSTAGGGICIATNGQPTLLPVMLIMDPGAVDPAAERHPLAWCHPGGHELEAGAGRGALIVYPE
jgi:hypothetical protein